jgi:hypothetical protein
VTFSKNEVPVGMEADPHRLIHLISLGNPFAKTRQPHQIERHSRSASERESRIDPCRIEILSPVSPKKDTDGIPLTITQANPAFLSGFPEALVPLEFFCLFFGKENFLHTCNSLSAKDLRQMNGC